MAQGYGARVRALVVSELSGPGGLRLSELPDPSPAEGTTLIEVHSAGAGFIDLLLTRGEYQIKPPLPFVPGVEVAGIVRGGDDFAEGTRVCATVPFGGFAELALAPSFLTFAIPDGLGFDQAAMFPVGYQTAHLALLRRGRPHEGETVLVHGASGGVGVCAVQVARACGAHVIAVASKGGEEVLDPAGDWVAAVRELTGGRGADVVFDPVGGERFTQSLRCMAPEGRILVVGFASGEIPKLEVNRLLLRHLDVVGVNLGGMPLVDPGYPAAAMAELLAMWGRGALPEPPGTRRPLAEGAELLRAMERRETVGKPSLVVR
jgi:NADPH2:quinone reductase